MIDKRQESFKGYIYFDSIETAKKLSKEITPIIEVLLGKKFKQDYQTLTEQKSVIKYY